MEKNSPDADSNILILVQMVYDFRNRAESKRNYDEKLDFMKEFYEHLNVMLGNTLEMSNPRAVFYDEDRF